MDIKKLVTFAFASKRRKLATLTVVGLTGIGSLMGGGADDPKTPAKDQAGIVADTSPAPAESPATEPVASTVTTATPVTTVTTAAPAVHFANCAAATAAGAAPISAGEPGYRAALDRDGDGIACDK